MKLRNVFVITFLVALGVWAFCTWPLARYFSSAVPCTFQSNEADPVRTMVPGDHLQLLYHFWLFGDTLSGHTPWCYNLYEFNTGDDAERYHPHHYYLPFALVYSGVAAVATRAAAWNAVALLSLWISALASWYLARRYVRSDAIAAVAILPSLLLPFRWYQLCGGSPGGPASAWVPVVFLGLDLALRDGRAVGGWLAGLGSLFALLGDAHVFYFLGLATPAWMLLVVLGNRGSEPWRQRIPRVVKALVPYAALLVLSGAYTLVYLGRLAGTSLASGRSWHDAAIFSPAVSELFSFTSHTPGPAVHLGVMAIVLYLGGTLLFVFNSRSGNASRAKLVALLVAGGTVLVMLLALGTHGPGRGWLYAQARSCIPHFDKLRQPAKIMNILFGLLPVGFAFALRGWVRITGPRLRSSWALGACAVLLLAGYAPVFRAGICRLTLKQDAYAAVAWAPGKEPRRALALPLWPGDSAWSSVNLHYASLYHLRMVNGYSPAAPATYAEDIFYPFRSANQGILTDTQLDDLLRRNVTHLLFHEDAFPAKVSPFPVGITRQRLLTHPRLRPGERDGAIQAFEILAEPRKAMADGGDGAYYFPTRLFEIERERHRNAEVVETDRASGGACVSLASTNAWAVTREIHTGSAAGLRWMVRCRGHGDLVASTLEGERREETPIHLNASDWTWVEANIGLLTNYAGARLSLRVAEGSAEVDVALLTAGTWPSLDKGQYIELPATSFMHAGYTDGEGELVLRQEYTPAQPCFVGPSLPLAAGDYRVKLIFDTAAAPGTVLGELLLPAPPGTIVVASAAKAEATLAWPDNLPAIFRLHFTREADLRVHALRLERLR